MWALADSLSGCISEFDVYTGKKTNAVEKNLGANVKTLTQHYTNTFGQYINLTVNVWQDNKIVSVAATNGDPTMNVQVLRKKKDGTRIPVHSHFPVK